MASSGRRHLTLHAKDTGRAAFLELGSAALVVVVSTGVALADALRARGRPAGAGGPTALTIDTRRSTPGAAG